MTPPPARRGRPRTKTDETKVQRGAGTLDHALPVLMALADLNGPSSLSEIARAANMPAAKAHRYLSSFIAIDLVSQPEPSGAGLK